MAFSRSNSCRSMSPPHKGFFSPSGKPKARRNKPNAENVPPNTPPLSAKSSSKAANKPGTPAQSPGLPPRPPPSAVKLAKRKLQWDAQAPQNLENLPLETSEVPGDTGVTVVVRVRPFSKKETQDQSINIITNASADSLVLGDQQFTFDAVSGESSTQEEMFGLLGLPMVENCLAGFNSSIFAYGQTGSGKTYTMWGVIHDPKSGKPSSDERGITPRVFETLFTRIREEEAKNADKQLCYQCRCSFLEIYNEQIADLLEPRHKNLQVREDVKTGVYVDNLTEEYVSNMDDVSRLLLKGLGNRRMGSTSMNVESSRSHTVFTCVLECRYKTIGEGMSSVRRSRINLVDLAGSERQKQSGAAGERLKEAGNINRSLSQLGNVINILAEIAQTGKQRHVPYRDSRLTFLLQESLGGNAKLAMICAISPADCCKSESTSTLRFAQRAKAIKNKAVVNEETTTDSNLLREQIRQLKDELKRMKSREKLQGGGDGAYSNGCNARRSYNLLRLSLALPMTLPTTAEESDSDEEMEIDEDAVEGKEVVQASSEEQDTNIESGVPAEPSTDTAEPSTDIVPYEPRDTHIRRSQALRSSMRSSKCSQATDRIAASLQKGLQVLEENQEEDVRFSFKAPVEPEEDDHSPERMPQPASQQDNFDSQARREVEELEEALELAMTGHAKLLEQYAELQEKHVALVTKQRKIREGVNDVRQMALKAGANVSHLKWLEAQAAQVVALNLEREQEREAAREEIEFLESQLRDTAEAVQAAGELLVRLKEAEEAVAIANDAAALAAQDADRMEREMEKMKRRHATEMATLQQRLLESRLQRATACPMCVMAERVKFEFTEVDPETAAAALEAENDAAALECGEDDMEDDMEKELGNEYYNERDQAEEEMSPAWDCRLDGELPAIEEEDEQVEVVGTVAEDDEQRKTVTVSAEAEARTGTTDSEQREIHDDIHDDLYDESDDRCNF